MTPELIKEAKEGYAKCNWATPNMAATGEFFEWGDVYGLDLLDHIAKLEAENEMLKDAMGEVKRCAVSVAVRMIANTALQEQSDDS